jgi:DNA mismatch endonuclease (patch repair protein)
MADVFTKAKRSQVMAAIRSSGNRATELRLATIFRAHGITGWRRHTELPGKPDFVFPRNRLAIFVDGCFWHACPKHGRRPESNARFWALKLDRNLRRDRQVNAKLRAQGWRVVRLWQHNLTDETRTIARILRKLLEARRDHEGKPGRKAS